MSYASIAKHNIPEGEMPQPDQNLLAGHFEGETAAHADVDHKVNVLPAGTDPEHPDIKPTPAPHPEPITLHHVTGDEGHHAESVAPKPLPTPEKHSIHVPESGEQWEKEHKKAEKKVEEGEKEVKEGVKEAEKEVKSGLDKAQKEVKSGLDKAEKNVKDGLDKAEKKSKELAKKAKAELSEAESKMGPYWEKTKDVVLRPGTLGGLMGVVNVGLLGTLGYFAYTRKDQPWDRRLVGGAVAGTLALFGAEGYVAESYLQTEEGRTEAERAKREGSKFYLQAKEVILRPKVAGGLAGAVNVAVLGALGYFSYKNWDRRWDQRTVSAIAVGLLGLSGLEGYAGKVYADKH